MKKTLSIFVAILMILALSIPAFAAGENNSITITQPAGITDDATHLFQAYQIFAGKIDVVGGNNVLTDIVWGSGINGTAFLAELKADPTFNATPGDNATNIFATCTTAEDVANVLKTVTNDSAMAQAFAKLAADNTTATTSGTSEEGPYPRQITGLDDGYYVIKDGNLEAGDYDAYSRYILSVFDNTTVTAKADVPSVEKKVLEESYTSPEAEATKYGEGYNDIADYDIGDEVPFRFYGTMHDNIGDYATYEYNFYDTMAAGLTFKPDSVTVTIDDVPVAAGYTVVTTAGDLPAGVTFGVKFADIKAATAEGDVAIPITATSKVVVSYKATLNDDADIGLNGNENQVYLVYSNNPYDTGDTGTTPIDKVVVFTYELDVTKVDGQTTTITLPGAQFRLYKDVAGTRTYVQLDTDNGNEVTDNTVTGWTEVADNATVLTTGDDGFFKFVGLDEGTYFLEELVAPNGYNLLQTPVEVTITATTTNGQGWNGVATDALTALATTSGEADVNTGIVAMQILNNTGATLPSTGGIGTTIFYVVGIAMMLGAAILLITKKRMTVGQTA